MENVGRRLWWALCLCALTLRAGTPGDKVAHEAGQWLHVREHGVNSGPEVELFQAFVKAPPKSSWCGGYAFSMHLFSVGPPSGDPARYAWVPSWFSKADIVWRNGDPVSNILPGDVVSYYYPKLGRDGHILIVEEVEGRWLVVISGNTNARGSRDGQGVHRHRIHIDQVHFAARHWDQYIRTK